MTECTTHHFACDCREEKFKQLELENAALRESLAIEQERSLYWRNIANRKEAQP